MAEGRTNPAIGQLLFISPRAVEKHVAAIFTKLGLPARRAGNHPRRSRVLTFFARSARVENRTSRHRCAVERPAVLRREADRTESQGGAT